MKKIPYLRVKQRGEVFFMTKLSIKDLKKHVSLHYRDPYQFNQSEKDHENFEEYIKKIKEKGLILSSDNDEGVQRRLQLSRIENIKAYVENNNSNFFPNSVLLSADVTHIPNFEEKYLDIEASDFGEMELPENLRFYVIDGQHRLAGLFLSKSDEVLLMEMPIVLLFNVSMHTAAKLFADINGKQKSVNKSLLYDLHQHVSNSEIEYIKKYNKICQKFYSDTASPLYRQIKMLGTGSGAISQAFFIDMLVRYVSKSDTNLSKLQTQELYDNLFYYFKALQTCFPEDWPVPLKFNNSLEVDEYSIKILVNQKSQLVKTNGFGAIMRAFPEIYLQSNGTFDGYKKTVSKLVGKIEWKKSELGQVGGGSEMQRHLYSQIIKALN